MKRGLRVGPKHLAEMMKQWSKPRLVLGLECYSCHGNEPGSWMIISEQGCVALAPPGSRSFRDAEGWLDTKGCGARVVNRLDTPKARLIG